MRGSGGLASRPSTAVLWSPVGVSDWAVWRAQRGDPLSAAALRLQLSCVLQGIPDGGAGILLGAPRAGWGPCHPPWPFSCSPLRQWVLVRARCPGPRDHPLQAPLPLRASAQCRLRALIPVVRAGGPAPTPTPAARGAHTAWMRTPSGEITTWTWLASRTTHLSLDLVGAGDRPWV